MNFNGRRIDMPPDEAAWLSLRRQGIGASESAAVCGASRWASPYSIWLDKIGERDEWGGQESEFAQAGHRHEPTIAKWFAETWRPDDGNVQNS